MFPLIDDDSDQVVIDQEGPVCSGELINVFSLQICLQLQVFRFVMID